MSRKKFCLDRRRDFFLEIQPTVISASLQKWLVSQSHDSSAEGGNAVELCKSGKQAVLRWATMVLSEARGLGLFLVLRGGITCNG